MEIYHCMSSPPGAKISCISADDLYFCSYSGVDSFCVCADYLYVRRSSRPMIYEASILAVIPWGTVPDWVAVVGTVGSLFTALYLLKHEIDERKLLRATRETDAARAVSAWCQCEDDKHILYVRNGGEEPIYDCMVYADSLGAVTLAEGRTHGLEVLFGTVPPGSTLDDPRHNLKLQSDRFGLPTVEVEFTDA